MFVRVRVRVTASLLLRDHRQVKNKAAFLSGICHRFRDRQAKAQKAEKAEVQKIKEEEGIAELVRAPPRREELRISR